MDPKNTQAKQMAEGLKKSRRLRTRNVITTMTIGGIVLGIYGYTFYSVAQEKFMDDPENEAKETRARYRKTSAN